MQSSCPVVPPKKHNSPSANLEQARRHQVCQTLVFRPQKWPKRRGQCAPGDSPIGFGSRRLLLAPRREKARGRLRPPAARLRGAATPQLCAPAARRPPRPPAARPLCWGAAPEAEAGGRRTAPRRAAVPPPPGTGPRPAPGGPLFRGRGGRAGPVRRPAPLQRSGSPSPPPPPNFVPGEKPLSAPGAAPARPEPPPPAGLRERGAPGHLTARPVNQRPPSAPSLPAAAGRLAAPGVRS